MAAGFGRWSGMSGKRRSGDKAALIVIKREESAAAGHHGGAWKVAYADFVTAMMAFFLLMWLLNATTEAQRRGIADYFSPNATLGRAASGSGQPLGGRTPYDQGSLVSDRGAMSVVEAHAVAPPDPDEDDADASQQQIPPNSARNSGLESGTASGNAATAGPQSGTRAPGGGAALDPAAAPQSVPQSTKLLRAELERRERAAFEQAADQIRAAVRADPQLAELARQLAIDLTPEGLRIQILDEDRQPMFATGSAVLQDRARLLLQKVGPVLAKLPEAISISGHTDAAPYHGSDKSNWELSAERANATRRLLIEAGLQETRIRSVTGNADRDPLLPADPLAAANRRIAIVVLRTALKP
jgi:chemotaxis protein MotB